MKWLRKFFHYRETTSEKAIRMLRLCLYKKTSVNPRVPEPKKPLAIQIQLTILDSKMHHLEIL